MRQVKHFMLKIFCLIFVYIVLKLIKNSKKVKLEDMLEVGASVSEALQFKSMGRNDQLFAVKYLYSSPLKVSLK